MKSVFDSGLWYCTYKDQLNGKIYMGFSPTLAEAMNYTFELLEEGK